MEREKWGEGETYKLQANKQHFVGILERLTFEEIN